ncbi:integral membrane protein, putative [Eimeria maxima]|uniref:Integral membrane protein, putative n=1 Tax=Eimeria maxima TaxID=5804 RepID=U6M9R6_EIMMA|nr:integral membrane protein, putative [Eimeria maxima]CDJ59224.1 integral membrane protein, putative [Eimeria maxima]
MQQDKTLPLLDDPGAVEAACFAAINQSCCGKGGIPYRDLDKARLAYKTRDVDATRQVKRAGEAHQHTHQQKAYDELSCSHTESHKKTSSDYLKAIVFGGLDGIVTIFAIVAGCVGANLHPSKVVIIGIGNLLADAISMGFGEFVSSAAEEDFVKSEREREEWEIENCPNEEKQEMVEIYRDRYGFTDEDADCLVNITFKYREFFVQHMMVEELGLMANEGPSPIRRGAVMFASFSIFGLLPLAGFVAWLTLSGMKTDGHLAFAMACVISGIALFILGFFKGRFVNQSPLKSGLLMIINGTCAGTVAYAVGAALEDVVAVTV